jgi:hypothetical protein
MNLPPFGQLLKESNGQYSSIRGQTWLIILCFCGDWITHIVRGEPFAPDLSIVGIVVGVLGAKVGQKFAENKESNSPSN